MWVSTVDLRKRSQRHWALLRKGRHHNKYLQLAWNYFRVGNFEFEVLALIKSSLLLKVEQSRLNKIRCIARHIGFDISPRAIAPEEIDARTWQGFAPLGTTVAITNLCRFCRQNLLDSPPSMTGLSQGHSKLKSHKARTHKIAFGSAST